MLTGLFVLAAGATGPVAAADPLIRDADAGVSAACILGNDDYEVVLTLGYSDRDGPAATIEVLDSDHIPVMGGYGTDSTWTADSFTGAVRLYSDDGFLGTVTFAGRYAPAGEPRTEQIRDRHGNRWTDSTLTVTELDMTLSEIHVPGMEIGGSSCSADHVSYSSRGNDPAARVNWSRQVVQSGPCRFDGGEIYDLEASLGILDLAMVLDRGDVARVGEAELPLRGRTASGPVPLRIAGTGEPAGSATVQASVRALPGQERHFYDEQGQVHLRTRVAPRALDFDLLLPEGTTLTATCEALEVAEHIVQFRDN